MINKTILILLITMLSISANAQNGTYKTSSVCFSELNSSGEWENWTTEVPIYVVVKLNTEKKTITIFTDEIQTYTQLYDVSEKVTEEGYLIKEIRCVNKEGNVCTLIFAKVSKTKTYMQICYSDMLILYVINPLVN